MAARPFYPKSGIIRNRLVEIANPDEFLTSRNVLCLDDDITKVVLERFDLHAQSLN